MTGGIRGANDPNRTFWGGAWRGATVGAIGGALGMVGGAGLSFGANVLLGAGQGAVTGALDAALWGGDIGQGIACGAAGGAIFAAATSENLKNAVKGKGFKNNTNVFKDFQAGKYTGVDGVWQQDALDYFGFDGKYVPNKSSLNAGNVQGQDYYGVTNAVSGDISYGNLAFDNYSTLRAVNVKETFHSQRILSGLELATSDIPEIKYYPEEALGFRHAFRNSGLYKGNPLNAFSQANSYWVQSQGEVLIQDKISHFIYNLPRRW